MKKLFFIISIVIIPFIAKGQDTLIYPSSDMLYSSWSCLDSIYEIRGHSTLPHHYAIENYGENTHTIYGIAVTAKFPIPANSTLRFYERIDGAVRITDTIAGQTVPYPFNYYIKYYLYPSATTTASKTIPCFLYLFDTPHKNIDTFYVGLNAPLSVWVDSNQIYIYDILYWTPAPDYRGQTFMYVNEDIHDPAMNLYDRYTFAGGAGGSLYPLIGLPCTAPQAPSISVVGDPGNYEVQLRKACRYTTASYDTLAWSPWGTPAAFSVSSPAGIIRIDQAPSFSLFPNPASASVTVIININEPAGSQELMLSVLDLHGRELISIPSLTANSLSLDISTLDPGTYLLRLSSPSASASRRLVVR